MAWTGFDRDMSGGPVTDEVAIPTFAALQGAARPDSERHAARHAGSSTVGGVSSLIRAARARDVTAGVVLACGSVLAAAVVPMDGTLGPQSHTAHPELAPGKPAPAALPGARAAVETAAASTPVSAAPGAVAAGPLSEATATSRAPHTAPPAVADAGSAGASSVGDGAAASGPSGSMPAEPEAQGSGADPAGPPDGAADEQRPSPIEQLTEPVGKVTEAVWDAGQPAMSMLTSPLP